MTFSTPVKIWSAQTNRKADGRAFHHTADRIVFGGKFPPAFLPHSSEMTGKGFCPGANNASFARYRVKGHIVHRADGSNMRANVYLYYFKIPRPPLPKQRGPSAAGKMPAASDIVGALVFDKGRIVHMTGRSLRAFRCNRRSGCPIVNDRTKGRAAGSSVIESGQNLACLFLPG